jgi:2-hydroxychromene-2-carboxylate isomerase
MPTRPSRPTDHTRPAPDTKPKLESRPTLEFWYDFASTYSYLSAMRIEELAAAAHVSIAWRPFLLGPIFAAQGWSTSPFNVYPAKGRYMIRDMERLSAERGLVFHRPTPFPQHSVLPARVALVGAGEGWIAAFTRRVFEAQFAHGLQLHDSVALSQCLTELGLDSARIIDLSSTAAIKDSLRRNTSDAQNFGLFGAPIFRTSDGEIYWGDDRLLQALRAAALL